MATRVQINENDQKIMESTMAKYIFRDWNIISSKWQAVSSMKQMFYKHTTFKLYELYKLVNDFANFSMYIFPNSISHFGTEHFDYIS